MKIKINQSKYAIWANPLYGPVFGRKDLHYLPVYNNIIEFYNCELGNTYQHPNHQKDSNEAKRFFSGFHSETSEIEVYQII